MLEEISLSESLQDYLEKILELAERHPLVRVTDIAKEMQLAKASVNQSIGKLKTLGLVTQQAYGPILLTDRGRNVAIAVRTRHTQLRHFLIEVLGVDEKVAEVDACKMEHAVSAETMGKLTRFLCNNGYFSKKKSPHTNQE